MFGDSNTPAEPQSDNNMMQSTPLVGTPANPQPAPATDAGDYMLEDGTPATSAAPTPAATTVSPTQPTPANPDDLLDLKREALTQLSPLLGHLDQSPEEKFRTTMMLIQASDDDSLLKQAYEAANSIQDEKARAQALLDVVNEINYFTQHVDQNQQ